MEGPFSISIPAYTINIPSLLTKFATGPSWPLSSGSVSWKLNTWNFPSLLGPNIRKKASLSSSSCPVSVFESNAASKVELVTANIPAIRLSSSPQLAMSEPECGVPKKIIPFVESRMVFRVASAPVES